MKTVFLLERLPPQQRRSDWPPSAARSAGCGTRLPCDAPRLACHAAAAPEGAQGEIKAREIDKSGPTEPEDTHIDVHGAFASTSQGVRLISLAFNASF